MENVNLKRNSSEILNFDVGYSNFIQQINNKQQQTTRIKFRKSFPIYENNLYKQNDKIKNAYMFYSTNNNYSISNELKKRCNNQSHILTEQNNEQIIPFNLRLLAKKHQVFIQNKNILQWSHQHSSPNISIVDRVCRRKPIAQFTDLARVDYPIDSMGVYIFKITWPTSQRGSHACIGLSTLEIPNSFNGYCSLLGKYNNGWCWDISRGVSVNNSLETKYGNAVNSSNNNVGQQTTSIVNQSDIINMIYDGYNKSLSFVINNNYFGVAIDNINTKNVLYPSISSVWGNCEIVFELIGVLNDKVPKLMDICFYYSLEYYGKKNNDQISNINLQNKLKKFVNN